MQKYGIESEKYELTSCKGIKLVGSSKLEIWERLVFSLSVAGLLPVHDLVSSVRVENENILKISTKNARMIKFKFNKLWYTQEEILTGTLL